MANTYSEAFLDSLSRASDSVGGLISVMRQPNWKQELMMQSDLRIKELKEAQKGDESKIKLSGDIESRQIGERGDVESNLITERGDVQSDLIQQEGTIKKDMQGTQIQADKDMQEIGIDSQKDMQKTAFKYDLEKIKASGKMDQELSILEHQNNLLKMQEGTKDDMEKMILGSDLNKDELEFQKGINQDMAYMTHYLQMDAMDKSFDQTKELKGMDYTNESDMAAVRHVFQQQILTQQAEIAYGQMQQQAMLDMEKAGYSSLIGLSDLEFEETTMPQTRIFGTERPSATAAREQFAGLLAMYHLQVPGALQDKAVNPNSFTAQEAISDADSAIEVAASLMDFAESEGFEDDADYYGAVIRNLQATRNRLAE